MKIRKVGGGWQVRGEFRRTFSSKKAALRFRAEMRSLAAQATRRLEENKTRPSCSIREYLETFLSNSAAGIGRPMCGAKTIAHHRRRLLAFDRAFHSAPIAAYERAAVERWLKKRLKTVSADTANADLSSLKAFARWAIRNDLAPERLSLLLVERLRDKGKLPGKNRRPPKALEMGEMLRDLDTVERHHPGMGLLLRGMVLFGLRPVEVAQMRRRDAKLPAGDDLGRLHCSGVKGHPPRDIPVAAGTQHHAWLEKCLEEGRTCGLVDGNAPLVPHPGGRSRIRPGGWTTQSLDMELARLREKVDLRLERVYQARHTLISWLQSMGISTASVQQYAGHMKPSTQDSYSHRHAREAMAAYEKVSGFLDLFDA